MADEVVPVIVEAVGCASGSLNSSGKVLAGEIQKAMGDAVLEAMSEGISDPVVIKERMMSARQRVKEKFSNPIGN